MLEKILNPLGLPTKQEVLEALDPERWRTAFYIRDLIDKARSDNKKTPLSKIRLFGVDLDLQTVQFILKDSLCEGNIRVSSCDRLKESDVEASDDQIILKRRQMRKIMSTPLTPPILAYRSITSNPYLNSSLDEINF